MKPLTFFCRYLCTCSCSKLPGSSNETCCSRFVDSKVFMPEFNELSRNLIISPLSYSMPFEIVSILTSDGFNLMAYLIHNPHVDSKHFPTFILYHGNGGNIGDCLPLAEKFYTVMDCNILIVDYRGYGYSEGVPSENGVYLDAQASFDFVQDREDLDSTKIIVFGISMGIMSHKSILVHIGGAVAIDLATQDAYKDRIAVLIVENTFSSLVDFVHYQTKKCCMGFVKLCQFSSFDKISKVECPTLFISGLADNFIPPDQMTKLYGESGSKNKKILRFPEGGHLNTFSVQGYGEQVAEFISKALKNSPNTSNKLNNNHSRIQNALDPNEEITLQEFLRTR